MNRIQRIHFLFSGYTEGRLTREELDELLVWLYDMPEEEKAVLSFPLQELWQQAKDAKLPSTASGVNWDNVYQQVIQSDDNSNVIAIGNKNTKSRWISIAAAVIGICIFSAVYWLRPKPAGKEIVQQPAKNRLPETVMPGSNNAILTLSGGTQIVLDSAADGRLAEQGGTEVIKLKGGQLAYRAGGNRAIVYNIISTPRAANYQVTLSDGSKIWLNAASSIRFPAVFSDTSRNVELTGEAYFEVAKNQKSPFRVTVKRSDAKGGDMEVEVLGTHFNVMAYDDERDVKTTLLEGAVKVKHGNSGGILEPGRQAQLSREDGKISMSQANVNMAVAWKNGYFYFDKSDVKSIMRQVGRWYDLDIKYEGNLTDMLFSGKIEKKLPLSGILNLLKQGKINFLIEGKQLTLAN